MPNFRATFSANQSVRAFLAEIGGLYHGGKIYDHKRKGWGLETWQAIVAKFGNSCVYCGVKNKPLSVEHLIESNRYCGGLHHPGNTVPACSPCNNSRHAGKGNVRLSWQAHLAYRWKNAKTRPSQEAKLLGHLESEYPVISPEVQEELKATCEEIYKEAQLLIKPYAEKYATKQGFATEPEDPDEVKAEE